MGTSTIVLVLQIVGYLAFIPGVWQIGNQFCRLFLKLSGSAPTAQKKPHIGIRAGRHIGFLERVLIIIGLIAGTWELIVAVVALKTVARYNDLDDQATAEYFLIGSLASILWALVVAGLFKVYDTNVGHGLIDLIRA